MALDLLEKEYKHYFNFIIIICPRLKHKETFRSRKWFWDDLKVILIEPGNHLYDWVERMGKWFAGFKTLFLIDDIIADETRRQLLLELAISGNIRSIYYGC